MGAVIGRKGVGAILGRKGVGAVLGRKGVGAVFQQCIMIVRGDGYDRMMGGPRGDRSMSMGRLFSMQL